MKKLFLLLVAVIVASVGLQAQQIAVVSKSGTTSIYKSLPDAVEKATAGSTVYLPAGGVNLTDTLRITKKLTLVGVGYNITGGNADGVTTISGNIAFNKGSSGSAIMGVYMPSANNKGYIYIGKDGSAVEDIVVKYCWVGRIEINNSLCTDCVINQNYCSSTISLGRSNAKVTNNICYRVANGDGAEIAYNIIPHYQYPWGGYSSSDGDQCINCVISKNIVCVQSGWNPSGNGNQFSDNMSIVKVGEDYVQVTEGWDKVFVNYGQSANPSNDFHFTEAYQQFEGLVGIYAGSGFNDSGMPPVPYISYKYIPDHTDADGNLNIKIRVKASE